MHFMTLGYCTIAVALLNNNKYLYELSIFSSFFLLCPQKKHKFDKCSQLDVF